MYMNFTPGDFTAPTIISTTPADGATGVVRVAGTYTIEFSEAMDETVTAVVTNLPGAVVSWLDNDTLEIAYTALSESTTHFVDLTGPGCPDLTMNALTGDMYMDFATIDITIPAITATNPADGATGVAVAAGTYYIDFSEAMDQTVTAFLTDLPGAVGSCGAGFCVSVARAIAKNA